jgi:hypothetical protein
MISKHISRKARNDDYGRLARYIADAGHEGEKCLESWSAGCWSGDEYALGILEAEAVQDLNTRSAKEKTYHLLISFRPEDEAKLTPEAFKAIEERFAQVLGFAEHQRHCGVHKNTNNLHFHIAYNMIHPERQTRHEPFRDYHARDRLCRELEKEYGLVVDNGRGKAGEDHLSEKAATLEAQTGQESFESYAKRHKAHILKALEVSQGWQGFHEALRAVGMEAKPHGNGLVVKNLYADHVAKASTIDRALSMKKLESRFGRFQPYRSLRPVQELFRYQAVPLHRDLERGELFARYQQGIESRKTQLQVVKEREDAALAAIRRQWTDKLAEIKRMEIAKRNRRNLLALARKHEAEAIVRARLALQPEREAVRRDIPFSSWSGFLRHEAEQGNETALAVLRSKGESVEPEREVVPSKVKDWSQHGREQFLTTRADHAAKERTLLEREDLSAEAKKSLQAFLWMERIAAEAKAQGHELGDIARRIDGKGVIIFILASGGSIRDTGKELFYSPHDEKAQGVALAYAALKWGKNVVQENGKIMFHQALEIKRNNEQKRQMDFEM